MKKMITMAAALAAGIALADVQSANVVGYQNNGFAGQGYAMGAATFLAVGTAPADMTLGMLAPNDAFYQRGSKITFVSPGGGNAKYYSDYFKKEVTKTLVYQKEDDAEDGEGWYLDYDVSDEGGLCNMNNLIKLEAGEGFFAYRMGQSPNAQLIEVPPAIENPVED